MIRLGSNLVMTRLLVPEMFGVMTIAAMVTTILGMLSDIGVRQHIVQNQRGDDPAFLDTAWVVSIIRGVVLWLVALLLSGALYLANLGGVFPVNSVYASSVLSFVISVSSFQAVIIGFQSTKMATAHRNFDQKRLVQIETISNFAGVVVMVLFGVISHSIWALVAGGLVVSLSTTTLSHTWLKGHPNRFRRDEAALRELIGFGKWIFTSSVFSVLAANGDRLLLGVFVDARVLGLYAIAMLIVGAIERVLRNLYIMVSLPALSDIARNNPKILREVYYKMRVPSDLLLLFLTGLLFATGQLVIDLLYDSRYSETGSMLQILSLSLITVRYGVANQAYLAMGVPRYLTVINVVRFVSFYVLVPLLYHLAGLQGAIWGIALHSLVTVPFVYRFNAKLGLNDFRRELWVLMALPAGFLCGSALNLVRG